MNSHARAAISQSAFSLRRDSETVANNEEYPYATLGARRKMLRL
jgi:hypothetical protein